MTSKKTKKDSQTVSENQDMSFLRKQESPSVTDDIELINARYLRAVADYQNLSKRVSEERETIRETANEDLIRKILDIVDDLEKSTEHVQDAGVHAIYRKLLTVLESEGLQQINPINESFDAGYQEAVDSVSGQSGKVCAVYRKGYLFHGKVLRPALVAVGNGDTSISS